MKPEQLRTLEDAQAYLEGTQAVVFEVAQTKAVRYQWIEPILFDSDIRSCRRNSAVW